LQPDRRPVQDQPHVPPAHAPAETLVGPQHHSLSVDVVVGASRLHMVSLPELCMRPIYWSPVNDNAVAMRATWFYRYRLLTMFQMQRPVANYILVRDTMLPVPPDVANQLESGYEELRPWTETWNDELKCAVEVGPLGEEKVSHRLWPD